MMALGLAGLMIFWCIHFIGISRFRGRYYFHWFSSLTIIGFWIFMLIFIYGLVKWLWINAP